MKQLIIFALLAILVSSCAKSLTYSPSLNLPNQPLKKKEVDLQAGLELLPESKPDEINASNSIGFHGTFSYGFSEKFNVSLKGWVDTGANSEGMRPGLSLTGQFIRQINPTSKLLIIPRIGTADMGWGYGLSNSVVYHKSQTRKFNWYSGLGVGWGFYKLEKFSYNSNKAPEYPFGYIIMSHLGIGYNLSSSLRLNCELNPIYQINPFDEVNHLLFSPSVGLGYTLRSKSESE